MPNFHCAFFSPSKPTTPHVQAPNKDSSEEPYTNPIPRFFAVDGHPPSITDDWRLFRARLVARELGASLAPTGLDMLVKPHETWAHTIAHPERGCLLVARRSNLGMFSHSVVLVTEHDDKAGTSALVLNMPTPLFIANLGLEEDITAAFGQSPLFIGGPMTRNLLHILHGRRDVEGSMEIVKGVYAGGVESASELIRHGGAVPSEFRLLAGYSGWGPGQLMQEIADGAWYVVAASDSLILDCIRETSSWEPTNVGLGANDDVKLKCWERVLKLAGIRNTKSL